VDYEMAKEAEKTVPYFVMGIFLYCVGSCPNKKFMRLHLTINTRKFLGIGSFIHQPDHKF